VSVAALARRPAFLHRRTGDIGAVDPYNADLGEWEATPTRAYGTQRRANEQTDDGGMVSVEDWSLVWADDLPAAAADRLDITGIGLFELVGPAQRVVHPQTNRFSHVEATGRLVT
jgi:hypothetical protein